MKILFLLFVTIFAASAFGQTPARVETELLGYLAEISKYGNYGGETDDEKLSAANDKLKSSLMNNGTKSALLVYAFPKLRKEMYVATSKDGKFRIYSWDMQTGGTMRDFAAVYQFRGSDGKTTMWAENDEDESAGSFYPEIFQVASKNGPIYLATSTFIGSTSMHGQSIKTIRIDGDDLDLYAKLIRTVSGATNSVGFAYDFFSVVDRKERPIKLFEFNETKKEFRFPVVVEDEETPQGRVTNKFITYRFNGTHFVKKN
jgi:hypothetical protein